MLRRSSTKWWASIRSLRTTRGARRRGPCRRVRDPCPTARSRVFRADVPPVRRASASTDSASGSLRAAGLLFVCFNGRTQTSLHVLRRPGSTAKATAVDSQQWRHLVDVGLWREPFAGQPFEEFRFVTSDHETLRQRRLAYCRSPSCAIRFAQTPGTVAREGGGLEGPGGAFRWGQPPPHSATAWQLARRLIGSAGAEGLEPPTYGFGDRRSTN